MPEISSNMVSTFHPLHPGITKRLIMAGFQQDEQQLPSLDELRNNDLEKGGPGSGRKYSSNHVANAIYAHNKGNIKHALKATGGLHKLEGKDKSAEKKQFTLQEVSHHLATNGMHPKMHSKVISHLNKAEEDELKKAEFNTAKRKKLAKEGEARKDGSFPIRNKHDMMNALHDVGRANNPAGAKAWIKKRAKELGLEEHLPEDWHKAEDVTESVGEGPGIEGGVEKSHGGEGSKGGYVVGHTKSGKPVYINFNHPGHKKFTSQDHKDAASIHSDKSYEAYAGMGEHAKLTQEGREDRGEWHEEQQKKHEQAQSTKKKNGKVSSVEKAFENLMSDPDPVENAFDALMK